MTYHSSRLGFGRKAKHAIAATSGRALRLSRLRAIGDKFFAGCIPIVFYHGIWPAGAPALKRFDGAELDLLLRDLKILADHFDFVSLEHLLKYNMEDTTVPRPLLSICFDDGCDMIRSGAADLLDSLGVPATIFVVTACVDNRHLMWMHKFQAIAVTRGVDRLTREYNRLMAKTSAGPPVSSRSEVTSAAWCWPMHRKEEYVDALYQACDMPPVEGYLDEYRPYMTWGELREWISRGHSVGLHTRSHPFCDRLASSDVPDEILDPAKQLRSELGIAFLPFAYPFGNRFAREREGQVAHEAGLSCMLGVGDLSPRGTDPRHLDRVSGEDGLDRSLFGKPLLEALLRTAAPGVRSRDRELAVQYRGT